MPVLPAPRSPAASNTRRRSWERQGRRAHVRLSALGRRKRPGSTSFPAASRKPGSAGRIRRTLPRPRAASCRTGGPSICPDEQPIKVPGRARRPPVELRRPRRRRRLPGGAMRDGNTGRLRHCSFPRESNRAKRRARPGAIHDVRYASPNRPNPGLASAGMEHQAPHPLPAAPPATRELLKPTEVARRLGLSRTWLYAAAKDGRIPSIRIGCPDGPLRFVPADLDAWIDQACGAWRPATRAPRRCAVWPMRPDGDRRLPVRVRRRLRPLLRQGPDIQRRAAHAPRVSLRGATRPPADPDAGGGLPRRGRGGAGAVAERLDAWLEESFAARRRPPGGAGGLDAPGRIRPGGAAGV